jgi:spore maturation protein CgeB
MEGLWRARSWISQRDTSQLRVLVIGPKKPYFFETACARVFSELGCTVIQVDNKPDRWWLGGRDWFQLSAPERAAQDLAASLEIYRLAKKFKPDLIFSCKSENIRSEIFTLLKREIGCRLAIWYVDNPFHANVSSYQALRAIQKADFYFIWSRYLIDPLISAGASKVYFLPFAYDPFSYPSDLELDAKEIPKWKSDVCFVGTWDIHREKALEPLAGKEFDLAIFGQGWKKFVRSDSPLQKHIRMDSIWLKDTTKAFKGSAIVLNFLRQHNWKGHNFRTMEAAGIGGGALLTPYTEDQAKVLFTENSELFCFEGESPKPEFISNLLENKENLRQVSAAGQRRIFKDHLLEYRIREILEIVRKN